MKKKKIKVGMIALGCAKNRVDAELMLALLHEEGYEITADEEDADVIIINTCGFIDSAKEEAISAILEAAEYVKEGSAKGIVVTGCLAQRYGKEITKQLPEVNAVVGVYGYDRICEAVKSVLDNPQGLSYYFDSENLSTDYLEGNRILTTPKSYAYIKIAEGCDNRCTYCAIPKIRGKFRSRSVDNVVEECRKISESGIPELILVAQDTTMYGTDLTEDGHSLLPELIRRLDGIESIKMMRVLYLYPDEVTEDILKAISESKKMVRYFDIPLQHINDRILKLMNRRGNGQMYRDVIHRFRELMPDCIIRTSLITGFPTETQEEFEELLDFVKTEKLDRVGVFAYSKEDGTPAARLKGQVQKRTRERRCNDIMKAQQGISLEKNSERIGKIYDIIVDGIADDGIFYKGRSYMEAPDADGAVYFVAKDDLKVGDIVKVKILVSEEYDLTGEQV